MCEHSLENVITLYHIRGHQPLRSQVNAEADTLARICWLEGAPAEGTAEWLHRKTRHVGQRLHGKW